MSEIKQCPNGHFYEGDFCPYCSESGDPRSLSKVCDNHHCYSKNLEACPICGSSVVVDEYDWGRLTIEIHSIHLGKTISIKVNGKTHLGINYIKVYLSRGNKCGYEFCKDRDDFLHKDNFIGIDPDDDIWIGCSLIKGREIMKMCDMILDNRLSLKDCRYE